MEHQIELTAESLWSEVAGRLRGALNDTTYGTWFGDAQGLELNDDRFVLAVPNDFTRDWIDGHFLELIAANRGLGYLVQFSGSQFDTAGVFAVLFVIALLAVALNHLVEMAQGRLERWRIVSR